MDVRIKEVIDSIADSPRRNLSLGEMAESVCLSPSRFAHLFKIETGESPGRYLKKHRMAEAKGLLETTWWKVKDIGAAIGATDTSHFAAISRGCMGLFRVSIE